MTRREWFYMKKKKINGILDMMAYNIKMSKDISRRADKHKWIRVFISTFVFIVFYRLQHLEI